MSTDYRYSAILALHPQAIPNVDFMLVMEAGLQVLSMWNEDKLGPYDAEAVAAKAVQLEQDALRSAVDAERDRRTEMGFTFGGIRFQSREADRENIAGAATAAIAAMMTGAQPGNLRWANPDADFGWIAEDNSLVPMDAQTVFGLGHAAMAQKQRLIFAARALKDAVPIPADFAADHHWP
jgi:hypothetical protein